MRLVKPVLLPIIGAVALAGLVISGQALAGPHKRTLPFNQGKDVLANNDDLALPITPDYMLGNQTRDQNLALSKMYGSVYWDAWNCKDKPCDDAMKAKIRAKAKLVPRTKENWGLYFKPAS